jgi:hypothetical protein
MEKELKLTDLIGKKVYCEGWQYDNGGFIEGKVLDVVVGTNQSKIIVEPLPETKGSMSSFTMYNRYILEMLENGKTKKPNRLLNTGSYGELI